MLWMLAVKALYKAGGSACADQVEWHLDATSESRVGHHLWYAQSYGLVTCSGRNRAIWKLTPLGVAFCEGRASFTQAHRATSGRRNTRTSRLVGYNWIASLYPVTGLPATTPRQLELFP